MMPYMVGYCPCCEAQIMVKDAMGRWCSYKTTYRQADILFENNAKVRTHLCVDCLNKGPDLKALVAAITDPGSQAIGETGKTLILTYGEPKQLIPWTM